MVDSNAAPNSLYMYLRIEQAMWGRYSTIIAGFLVVLLISFPVTFGEDGPGPRDDVVDHFQSINGEIDLKDYLHGIFYGANGGSPYGDSLGQSMVSGDFDNDGYLDMALSAANAPLGGNGAPGNGEIYIYFGSASRVYVGETDLATEAPNVTIQGISAKEGAILCGAVLKVADFNNDSYDDLLFSAPYKTYDYQYSGTEGMVGIMMGKNRSAWSTFYTSEGADIVWGYYGADNGARLGTDLAVGDVNGDGFDDCLIGVPGRREASPNTQRGGAHIVLGGPSMNHINVMSDQVHHSSSLVKLFIASGFEGWGGTGVALGDLNGDGYDDMMVGTYMKVGGSYPNSGVVSVVLGHPDIETMNNTLWLEDEANVTIYGDGAGDQFGWTLDSGDLDGDGFDDIFIGSPKADGVSDVGENRGEVAVVFGTDAKGTGLGPWGTNDTQMWTDLSGGVFQTFKLIGTDDEDRLGYKLATTDIDGDGTDDLIGSAFFADGLDNKRDNSGEVLIAYGADRSLLPSYMSESRGNVDVKIYGGHEYDLLGGSVMVMDVTGDGIDDLLMSAVEADGPDGERRNCGEIYVLNIMPFACRGFELLDGYDVTSKTITGGDVCFSEYQDNTFRTMFSSRFGIDDIEQVNVTIDPDGLNIEFGATISGTSAVITEVRDPTDVIHLNAPASSVYIGEKDWIILDLKLKFAWDFPTEEHLNVTIRTRNATGKELIDHFPAVFRVENDLDLYSNLKLSAPSSGNVTLNGSWVRPHEPVQLSGPVVVYEGSIQCSPHMDDYSLQFTTSEGSLWPITTRADGRVNTEFNVDVPPTDDARVTHYLDIIDIGTDGGYTVTEDVSDVSWIFKVDGDGPTIHDIDLPEGSTVIDGVAYVHEDHANVTFGSVDDDVFVGGGSTTKLGEHIPYDTMGIRDVWATVGAPFDEENASHFRTMGGLEGRYYDTPNYDQLSFVRTDETIDFSQADWGVWAPNDIMNVDWFSVRWTGYLYTNYSSTYNFYITADNDARLYLDDVLVYDQWDYGGSGHVPLYLEKGFHPIRLDYRERQGVAHCKLEWQVSILDREVIPSYNLFHTGDTVLIDDLADGSNIVSLWAEDWLGNIGPVETFELLIDTAAPTIASGFEANTWYNTSSPILPMMLNDTESMIDPASLEFKVGAGEWLEGWSGNISPIQTTDLSQGYTGYVSPEGLGTGTHTLGLRCKDRAQNPSAEYSFDFKVDVTPPEVWLEYDTEIWVKDHGIVNVSMYDAHSAMSNGTLMYRTKHSTDAAYGQWSYVDIEVDQDIRKAYSIVQLWLLEDGVTYVQLAAGDSVGNINSTSVFSIVVKVPLRNYAPIAVLSAPIPNGTFISSEPIFFSASGSWDPNPDDNASLSYTWYEDGMTIFSSGLQFNESLLPGNYTFMLEVSDGRLKTEVWFWILVLSPADYHYQFDGTDGDGDGDGGNPVDDMDQTQRLVLVMVLLLVVLLLVLTFVIMYMYTRKKGKQTSMAIGSSEAQEDDETLADDDWLDQRAQVASSVTEDDLDEEAKKLYGKKKGKKKKGKKGKKKIDPDMELEAADELDALPPADEMECQEAGESDIEFDPIGSDDPSDTSGRYPQGDDLEDDFDEDLDEDEDYFHDPLEDDDLFDDEDDDDLFV